MIRFPVIWGGTQQNFHFFPSIIIQYQELFFMLNVTMENGPQDYLFHQIHGKQVILFGPIAQQIDCRLLLLGSTWSFHHLPTVWEYTNKQYKNEQGTWDFWEISAGVRPSFVVLNCLGYQYSKVSLSTLSLVCPAIPVQNLSLFLNWKRPETITALAPLQLPFPLMTNILHC